MKVLYLSETLGEEWFKMRLVERVESSYTMSVFSSQ